MKRRLEMSTSYAATPLSIFTASFTWPILTLTIDGIRALFVPTQWIVQFDSILSNNETAQLMRRLGEHMHR